MQSLTIPIAVATVILAATVTTVVPRASRAGTYCTSRGNATYCDDGTTFHQYGDYIQSNRGQSWRRFGSHVYGDDGSWFADHGDSVTQYSKGRPDALGSRIVPDRLFGDDGDD